jgi:hypothetical protein
VTAPGNTTVGTTSTAPTSALPPNFQLGTPPLTLPTIDALKAQWKGDRLMKKNSTVAAERKQIFKQAVA